MTCAVLLAEPQTDRRLFLERHLEDDGFEVVQADEIAEALELAERARPDLVLAGAELCRRLREGGRDVPVIVLGPEEADAIDRVRAFERGCDDYVSPPFHYEELVARIHAVLRRSSPPRGDVLEAGALRIDRATRRVTVGETRVDLAAKEYELLVKLASDPYRVFTKDELLRDVWGFRFAARTRTLDSHASRLRRKLTTADPQGGYVMNVWGVGYRLLEE
jgi:DNA-binding response OmpR family regulator